jgi:hypothetical protein
VEETCSYIPFGEGWQFSLLIGARPALGPAYPGFKFPHVHQFENKNWILYQLFHVVNLATRSVKRVKTVFKHNSYSKLFFWYGVRDRGRHHSNFWAFQEVGPTSRQRKECFSNHHHVQTGSGAHPTSYPMGTRCSFRGNKAGGAWSWTLTSSI